MPTVKAANSTVCASAAAASAASPSRPISTRSVVIMAIWPSWVSAMGAASRTVSASSARQRPTRPGPSARAASGLGCGHGRNIGTIAQKESRCRLLRGESLPGRAPSCDVTDRPAADSRPKPLASVSPRVWRSAQFQLRQQRVRRHGSFPSGRARATCSGDPTSPSGASPKSLGRSWRCCRRRRGPPARTHRPQSLCRRPWKPPTLRPRRGRAAGRSGRGRARDC